MPLMTRGLFADFAAIGDAMTPLFAAMLRARYCPVILMPTRHCCLPPLIFATPPPPLFRRHDVAAAAMLPDERADYVCR
jgi:hypothetical protein